MAYTNNANDTAVQAGWSLGDYGIITDNDEGCHHDFDAGDVVQLAELDGSSCPLFVRLRDERTQYVDIVDGVDRVSTSLPRVFYTRCGQYARTRLKKSPALQSLGKWLNGQDFADSDIDLGVTDCGWLQFDGKVWHGEVGSTPYPDHGAVAIDLEELEDWAAVVDAQAEYGSAYPAKIKEEEELKTPAEKLGLKVGSKVVAGSPRSDSAEVRVGDVLGLIYDDGTQSPKFLVERTGQRRYYVLRDTRPYEEGLTPAAAAGIFVGTECVFVSAKLGWGLQSGDTVTLSHDDASAMPEFEVPLPCSTLYLHLNTVKPKSACSPAELGGYVKGARCVVIEEDGAFEQGTIVTLARDDWSECPLFESVVNPEDQHYLVLGDDVVLERLYEAPEAPEEEDFDLSPAAKLGYIVGDTFIVQGATYSFPVGSLVTLKHDDMSDCPRFTTLDGSEGEWVWLTEVVKVNATLCQEQGIVQGAVCFLKEDYVNGNGTTILKRGDVVVVVVDDGTQRPHCRPYASDAKYTVFPYAHLLQPTGLILEQYAAKK